VIPFLKLLYGNIIILRNAEKRFTGFDLMGRFILCHALRHAETEKKQA